MSELDDEMLQIESFLRNVGLSELLPIKFQYSREVCNVWFGQLLTPIGDASAKILVYPLRKRPELIVEYEDEKASLRELTQQPWHLRPEMVLEGRTSDFGILVTTTSDGNVVFQHYLSAQKQSRESPISQFPLSYHPQLDRLLGGDYFHKINGNWLKACLLSIERAKYLVDLITALQDAYAKIPSWHGKIEAPFPVPLAVLELTQLPVQVNGETQNIHVEELFKINSLRAAPIEYHQLALMQSLLPSINFIQNRNISDLKVLKSFAHQLFKTIRCGHSIGATFSRNRGCCIRPEFLTVEGCMTDLYFLDRSLDESALHKGQQIDLTNGFLVLHEVVGSNKDHLLEIFHKAINEYLDEGDVHSELAELAGETVEGLINEQSPLTFVPSYLKVLVDSIQARISRYGD